VIGYPSWTGNKLTAEEVQSLFDGLEANGLTDDYTHVLTGKRDNIINYHNLLIQ
jgi:pyridoxine kinase